MNYKEEIDEFLNFAIRSGRLSPEDLEDWTWEQKVEYYEKAMAWQPNEE